MYGPDLRGCVPMLIWGFVITMAVSVVVGFLIGNDNTITTTERIEPELKITVKDNVIDTLYIYKEQ